MESNRKNSENFSEAKKEKKMINKNIVDFRKKDISILLKKKNNKKRKTFSFIPRGHTNCCSDHLLKALVPCHLGPWNLPAYQQSLRLDVHIQRSTKSDHTEAVTRNINPNLCPYVGGTVELVIGWDISANVQFTTFLQLATEPMDQIKPFLRWIKMNKLVTTGHLPCEKTI